MSEKFIRAEEVAEIMEISVAKKPKTPKAKGKGRDKKQRKDGQPTVVHYWVKAYDEGSQYGIDGGRISKLTLKISGEVVYNYDRGEDVPPQNEAAEMALAILMHEYN